MRIIGVVLSEPLNPERARKLTRRILETGSFSFSGHAEREIRVVTAWREKR
jgi:hypothetical protein